MSQLVYKEGFPLDSDQAELISLAVQHLEKYLSDTAGLKGENPLTVVGDPIEQEIYELFDEATPNAGPVSLMVRILVELA